MTTYFSFTPSPTGPYTFQPMLDGQLCTVVVTWNIYRRPNGQGWYVNVYNASGALIVAFPLIGSGNLLTLSALSWNENSLTATGTTSTPHGYKIGSLVNLTVVGCAPSNYNGTFLCAITGLSTLSYPIAQNTNAGPLFIDPGTVTTLGQVGYNINLVNGYFFTSTLIYRQTTGNFEINP